MACLKMAGAPAAQVSKGGERGFKDNNDHKDIKDAREGTKRRKGPNAPSRKAQENMRPSAQHWETRD